MKRDPNLSYPDNTPVEIPVRLRRAAAEGDRFKELVQRFSAYQAQQGNESIEEADDFDVGDGDGDLDFVSGHELSEMQEEGDMSDATFNEKRSRFVRARKERVQGDAGRGGVRPGEGRKDVSGGDAGGGTPPVRSVEQDEGVRSEGRSK